MPWELAYGGTLFILLDIFDRRRFRGWHVVGLTAVIVSYLPEIIKLARWA